MMKFLKFIGILFIVTAIFAVSAILGYAFVVPSAYVNMNANTSIGYSLNIYDYVIDFSSSDESGENAVCSFNTSYKKITDAVPCTIDKLIKDGYITNENKSNIIITVTSPDRRKAEKIVRKLEAVMKNYASQKSEIINVQIKAAVK